MANKRQAKKAQSKAKKAQSKAKKGRKPIVLSPEHEELYQEAKKLTKRANQRLLRLERYMGKSGSWASRKLQGRLEKDKVDAWTDTNRARVNKSMSMTQLRAIVKALEQFLTSETSTVKGVKNVEKSITDTIKKSLETEDVNISKDEAEAFYRSYQDNLDISKYFSPSEWAAIIKEAKEQNYGPDEFIDMIDTFLRIEIDVQVKEQLRGIWEKSIKPYIILQPVTYYLSLDELWLILKRAIANNKGKDGFVEDVEYILKQRHEYADRSSIEEYWDENSPIIV